MSARGIKNLKDQFQIKLDEFNTPYRRIGVNCLIYICNSTPIGKFLRGNEGTMAKSEPSFQSFTSKHRNGLSSVSNFYGATASDYNDASCRPPRPLGSAIPYIALITDSNLAKTCFFRDDVFQFYKLNNSEMASRVFDRIISMYHGEEKCVLKLTVWDLLCVNSFAFLKPTEIDHFEAIFDLLKAISTSVDNEAEVDEIVTLFRVMEIPLYFHEIEGTRPRAAKECGGVNCEEYEDFFFTCLASIQNLLFKYILPKARSKSLTGSEQPCTIGPDFLSQCLHEISADAERYARVLGNNHSDRMGISE